MSFTGPFEDFNPRTPVTAAFLNSLFFLSTTIGGTAPGEGAALVGRGFPVLKSMTELRQQLKGSAAQSAFLTGYFTQGDGGGGPFYLDASDTTSLDNGGTVIVATDGARWKRVYGGDIELDWFGAQSGVDTKAALVRAIAVADATPGGANILFKPGATYKMLSGITWNSTRVGFNGRGATLDCTSFTDQILLQPIQTGLDPNERVGAAWMRKFKNFRLRGPGFGLPACALLVDAPEDDVVNAGLLVQNCTFQAWATEIDQRRGAFFCTYEFCDFQGIVGAGTDMAYGIRIEAATNSGEKTTFKSCLFGGRQLVFDQSNGNADSFFYDCSFDYVGQTVMRITGGSANIIGGHTEGNSDVANWYQVSGADSVLNVTPGHTLTLSGPKSAFSPFYSDSTCTNGGVQITGMNIVSGPNPITTRLVGGAGRTKVKDCNYGVGASRFLVSDFQNQLTYPSFESANYVSDWTLTGTTPPARTNEVTPQSGTYSLGFSPLATDAAFPVAYTEIPCKAGDFAVVELWFLTVNLAGTGATLVASNYYVDKAGNQLGIAQQFAGITSNVSTWTKVTAGIPTAAPAGTYGYRIAVSVFGTSSGAPKAYIDSVSSTIG